MIYHIYANRSNIGDWLSAKGIQKLLSPIEVTECFCDGPFIKDTVARLSGATDKDFIVIGGGGLLMDYFTPFWKAFQPISHRVPFCIWGIGCCDLKKESSLPPKSLIEEIVNKSKFCIVRDELTRSFLQLNILPPSIPCPSINIIDPLLERGKDLLHVAHGSAVGANVYEAMCDAAKSFAMETGRDYRETNNRITKDSEKEMAHTLLHYQKSDIMLSSRLHGCIIGVAMGIKVLAVSGDRKIDAFMEAVGLQDWVLDVNEISLVPQHLKVLHSQTFPADALEDIRKNNQKVAENILKLAKNNLMEVR